MTTDFGAWASCGSVLVDGGKIVAGGQAAGSMAFVRYNSNGTLDNDFNGDGKLIVPMSSSSSIGRMALDSQGRIVAAGWARPAGFTFGLVRLRIDPANGTLDGTFGDNGTLITDVYNNWGSGMTIQGDGDIVVVGSESGGAFLTARYKGTGEQRLYYQQDANWNVTALVSADDASESYTGGVVVERYLTDPYGNVITLNGNWGGRISDSSGLSYYGNPYGFQGLRRDSISETYDDRARITSAPLGRALQEDPIGYGDGMNPYQREGSNPVTYLDPTGLLQVDANGNIRFDWAKTGPYRLGSDPAYYESEVGSIYANDGTSIRAVRPAGLDKYVVGLGSTDRSYNCHGYTFAKGQFWITNDQVPLILAGDGYKSIDECDVRAGDIVVYWEGRVAVHSGIVTAVRNSKITVSSKQGIYPVMEAPAGPGPGTAWATTAQKSYYRPPSNATTRATSGGSNPPIRLHLNPPIVPGPVPQPRPPTVNGPPGRFLLEPPIGSLPIFQPGPPRGGLHLDPPIIYGPGM